MSTTYVTFEKSACQNFNAYEILAMLVLGVSIRRDRCVFLTECVPVALTVRASRFSGSDSLFYESHFPFSPNISLKHEKTV